MAITLALIAALTAQGLAEMPDGPARFIEPAVDQTSSASQGSESDHFEAFGLPNAGWIDIPHPDGAIDVAASGLPIPSTEGNLAMVSATEPGALRVLAVNPSLQEEPSPSMTATPLPPGLALFASAMGFAMLLRKPL